LDRRRLLLKSEPEDEDGQVGEQYCSLTPA